MTYAPQTPANLYAGTEETDSTGGLFAPGYVFGVESLPIENNPGEAIAATGPAGDDQPLWVTAPPDNEPAPIASTVQTGANAKWQLWPAANGSVSIALPDGTDIRSLWIPVVPVQIGISLGFAGGALMYPITTQGGEIVPIPKGTRLVTLSAISSALKPDIWIYATNDIFTPNKTGINGVPLPLSGQLSPYDSLILGTTGIKYYYPMNDAPGSLAVADLGPNKSNGILQGGASLGGGSLLNDNSTSAQFDGGATSDIFLPGCIPGTNGNAPYSIEFWFNDGGNGPGQTNYCTLLSAGNGTIGSLRAGIIRANNNFGFGTGQPQDHGIYCKPGVAHHVVLTYVVTGGIVVNWYFDGNLVWTSNNANDAGAFDTTHGVTIGGSLTTTGGVMDSIIGNISKLAIYGRALTAQEVATHWSNHA